jgi:hypothetical protein
LTHGAAASNLIYCQNNTQIIEINSGANPLCYPILQKKFSDKTNINIKYINVFSNDYYQFISDSGDNLANSIFLENGKLGYLNQLNNTYLPNKKFTEYIVFDNKRIDHLL